MELLTAHWKHLLLANEVVEPERMEPYVPAKHKLDTVRGD